MAHIGQFTREKSNFTGRIQTLTVYRELTLVPADPSNTENAPDYRVHLGNSDGPEIGAGWKRSGEKAGDYVSLVIDDPTLTQPIRANLFQSDESKAIWVLTWSRPPKRNERD